MHTYRHIYTSACLTRKIAWQQIKREQRCNKVIQFCLCLYEKIGSKTKNHVDIKILQVFSTQMVLQKIRERKI